MLQSAGWNRTFDNNFALELFNTLPKGRPLSRSQSSKFCERCDSFVRLGNKVTLSELSEAEEHCDICALVLNAFSGYDDLDGKSTCVLLDGSMLTTEDRRHQIARLCVDPATWNPEAEGIADLQIGFPVLPEPGSPTYYALLRAWIERCDKCHDCTRHDKFEHEDDEKKVGIPSHPLPSRLLFVGNSDHKDDPEIIRLHSTSEGETGNYIALSYGRSESSQEEIKQFFTTMDNITQRHTGFPISDLPKTFQDAIKVTRELRIPYLWIDAICVIQGGDNQEDWKREARCMEDIFSSAYCTISATSATDMNSGFLNRNVSNEHLRVESSEGNSFYICTNVNDFDKDVEKAQISTRAWVMQERILSRRTIHFTENQMYWECGGGIYCEDLTEFKCATQKTHCQVDPHFPHRVLEWRYKRVLEFIDIVLEDFSKRGITDEADRPYAFSGLENRISRTLNCRSRYGVFEAYLHRNLMWHASDAQLQRIDYKDRTLPSWSWMKYHGAIQLFRIPYYGYMIKSLRFDDQNESALVTDIWKFRGCKRSPEEKGYATLMNFRGLERGFIKYDEADANDFSKEQCVVIWRNRTLWGTKAKKPKEYYILLVVRQTDTNDHYRRVGIGMVRSKYVEGRKANMRLV